MNVCPSSRLVCDLSQGLRTFVVCQKDVVYDPLVFALDAGKVLLQDFDVYHLSQLQIIKDCFTFPMYQKRPYTSKFKTCFWVYSLMSVFDCFVNEIVLIICLIFKMMEQTKAKFLGWAKIRIGEPLTAIEISNEKIVFGSISGYVGTFNLDTKKTSYFQQIDQELIRGICCKDSKIYIAIGDRHIRIKDLGRDPENDQMLSVLRSHSNIVCSHSMTMMYGVKIVIFCAFPTQKRQALSVQLEIQNKNMYQIDADKNQIKLHREFRMPQVAVPFDFDGNRILWMQYRQDQVKEFQYYDLTQKKVFPIKAFQKDYHFLSHGRLVGKQLIFVENNKNVKCFHTESKVQRDLYSHNSSIVAFSIVNRESPQYSIISVDFNGFFTQWRTTAIIQKFHLWDLAGIPKQIQKHQYLFDMGYAYCLQMYKNVIAVTTDLGLFIYTI